LGAGKTCLTGGLAEGLGVREPAASPTFVLLRSHRGARGLTLHHLDFYRLAGDDDLETIGLEDCFGDDTVIAVEWPSRCPRAFERCTLALRLDPLEGDARRIRAWAGALPLADGLARPKGLVPPPAE
jgi:tRNA threonylcarbamoyladenosine biosynthesis protein TsaE